MTDAASGEAGQRALLAELYAHAVAVAHPDSFLPPLLPEAPERGAIIILAAGKAAASMTAAAERHYRNAGVPAQRITGLAVTRHGYGLPAGIVPVIEAGHPVPDAAGVQATARILALAERAGPDDLVLALISGGGSANWIAPVDGVSLADKQALTKMLLRSGATISEINTVRRHLSRIKGGRLARAASRAGALVTLAISDVPGDLPEAIASGPTVPDASTLADARAVLARFGITPPVSIVAALNDPANESPKPDDPLFARSRYIIAVRPAEVIESAAWFVTQRGYEPVLLGSSVEGEARDVARVQANVARQMKQAGRRVVLLSGGELTVTIRGDGRGGPNQEYALALALMLKGLEGVAAVAGDTDGTDGGGGAASDPAGAFVLQSTLARAAAAGLDPRAMLDANDSTRFFGTLGDLLTPGPTFTNVNDFRAILIEP